MERIIQRLLTESGAVGIGQDLVSVACRFSSSPAGA
jgi:hypothetical protein